MRMVRSKIEKIMTDLNETFLGYERFMSENEGVAGEVIDVDSRSRGRSNQPTRSGTDKRSLFAYPPKCTLIVQILSRKASQRKTLRRFYLLLAINHEISSCLGSSR